MKLNVLIKELQKAEKRHGGDVEVLVNQRSFKRAGWDGLSHTATWTQRFTRAVEYTFNRKGTKKIVKALEIKSY